ncbi:PepSY domain-containing protein [Allopusillimonas ginsengisoli]|uniref:PepSY domain-containing protein n=1 Tax=Allopusillimonas ginsengisoli TaxID=453575 RepID=UPI001021065F|nr:PepSY domain-containing protein [Allopusillimonas ginsengisoli]TEA77787.1 PepSY domain-containing protein [Allopusillimonas ginsengisoli]
MASIWTRFKRLAYLVHRWTGIAACVLMAVWFVSGVVMLFVGYPKLLPAERLGALPPLTAVSCCVPVDQALQWADKPDAIRSIRLAAEDGRPYYRLQQADGRYLVVDARTGDARPPITQHDAVSAALWFAGHAAQAPALQTAAARTQAKSLGAVWLDVVQEDRWTHSGALNAHRPLHRIDVNDPAHTRVYVSSSTGEVVMAASRSERMWNYVGAWLHWLYMFRNQPSDPVWTWLVIALSGVGVVTAVSGTLVGLWRWRFSRPYKSGSRSPYRDGWMRWHHLAGLIFAGITCTWIFSGLMSMNPLGVFNPHTARPNLQAWQGGTPGLTRLPLQAPQALAMLAQRGFDARQLEWRVLNGQPYLLARDGNNRTRLILREHSHYVVRDQWPQTSLSVAAPKLMNASIVSMQSITRYDTYYFHRAPASMYGASERRLPILRIKFDDPDATWVYIDPYTGEMEQSLSRAQRTGRWLFNFLHSWDLAPFLKAWVLRDVVLILLSVGGLVLSATGIWIGYLRLRRKLA